ncbi:MAG: hypothetical protein Q9165_005430 [Trypethelium subeluteriae]
MAHKAISSKAEIDSAVATQGKNVLFYLHTGDLDPVADEWASKYTSTTDFYKIAVDKSAEGKQYFNVSTTPTIAVYKNGSEAKKVEGGSIENMEAIASVL